MRMRLLPLPFDSVFTTRIAADLGGGAHVGAAVGLLVEPDDVDDADLLHRLGDHVDLRADEVLVLDRRLTGQERHLDRAGGRQLGVDQLLDRRAEALGQRVELEVHPGAERLHVAAGDRRAPLVPDHTAQHVQGGVRAHRGRGGGPSRSSPCTVAPTAGSCAVERVPHAARRPCARRPPVDRAPVERAGVVGLAAAGRVEGGAVERDAGRPSTATTRGLELAGDRRRAGSAGRFPLGAILACPRATDGVRRSKVPRPLPAPGGHA